MSYIPEERQEELRLFDKTLYYRWNREKERYEVWCDPGNCRPYKVITVEEPGGGYRPIDNRVFADLALCDRARFSNKTEHLAAIDNAFTQMQKEKERKLAEWEGDTVEKLAWGIRRDFD